MKFKLGDRVRKIKGSSWSGLIVGTYSASLTPEGYAVESENEPGSVQIYPVSALEAISSQPVEARGSCDKCENHITECDCPAPAEKRSAEEIAEEIIKDAFSMKEKHHQLQRLSCNIADAIRAERGERP